MQLENKQWTVTAWTIDGKPTPPHPRDMLLPLVTKKCVTMHQTVRRTQENVGVRRWGREREILSCVEPAPHPGAVAMLLAALYHASQDTFIQCRSVSLKSDITLLLTKKSSVIQ